MAPKKKPVEKRPATVVSKVYHETAVSQAYEEGKKLGEEIGKKEKGWLRWIGKNVLASILIAVIVAATIWILVLYGQRNGLQTKFDNCQRSKSDLQTKAASDSAKNSVTALRSETSKIGETPTTEVKKNGTK